VGRDKKERIEGGEDERRGQAELWREMRVRRVEGTTQGERPEKQAGTASSVTPPFCPGLSGLSRAV
jgi:hypothetical protein